VYTRHPRFTAAPDRGNGHDVLAPALDAAATDAIVRAALTKEELQNLLFENIGLSKRECREMVNAIFEEMRVALEAGEPVKLEGFGRFQPKERPKRWARNLRSGEKIPISERRVVTFHPSKKLTASIGSRPVAAKSVRRARFPRYARARRSRTESNPGFSVTSLPSVRALT
jgi:integration host factor subunit alpha